jgi:prepilin signal peptidase PulO-like enzyme (type II secretory pathway)
LLSFLGQWGLGYNLRPALEGMLIFFLVFLLIYYGAKRYVAWKYKEKAEGFGFGDVLLAGVLGTMFPVFITLTSPLERIYLLCTYLILSCLFGLVLYGLLTLFHQSLKTPNIAMSKRAKIIPFLPAMILAFLVFTLYGNSLLSLLLPF